MFDQRNQQFQTIILSSSVMFSALSTVIIQGPLNQAASSFLLISYSLSTALAFALLFLSIVICIEIISRASKFMYSRAKHQTIQLQDAIGESIKAMKKLREDTVEPSDSSTTTPTAGTRSYQKQDIDYLQQQQQQRRNFASAHPKMVDNEWKTHEGQVFKFLKVREEINEKAWAFEKEDQDLKISDVIDASKVSFEKFWESRCQTWGEIAIGLFYVGSIMFLIGVMIFMWSEFYFTYSSLTGAEIAVVLIGIGMLLGVGIVIVLRYIRPPRLSNTSKRGSGSHHVDSNGSGNGSASNTDGDSDSADSATRMESGGGEGFLSHHHHRNLNNHQQSRQQQQYRMSSGGGGGSSKRQSNGGKKRG